MYLYLHVPPHVWMKMCDHDFHVCVPQIYGRLNPPVVILSYILKWKTNNILMILRHNSTTNDGITFSLLFLFILRRDRSMAMRIMWMFLWCVEHCNTTLLSRSSHVRYNHKYMDVIYLHVAPRVFSPHALMRLCGREHHANDCQRCASLTKHECFRQMTFTSFEDRIYSICGTFMLLHFLFLVMRYRSECFLLWSLMSMYLRHYCDS